MSRIHLTLKIGDRYGRLIIVGGPVRVAAPSKQHPEKTVDAYRCRCDCGQEPTIVKYYILSGNTLSCGCLCRERNREKSKRNIKHGFSRHDGTRPREYAVWVDLKNRCANPNHHAWKDYGGRGITVCDEWKIDFTRFFADMGPRPSPLHEIDRIDNEKGYSAVNCRWSTVKQQASNRRSNVFYERDGKRLTQKEWCKLVGISATTFCSRISRGWSVEDALTKPPDQRKNRYQ